MWSTPTIGMVQNMDLQKLVGGEIKEVGDRGTHMLVEVDGVEVFVTAYVRSTGCNCCGDTIEFHATYNWPADDRLADHGTVDPLNIMD